MELVLKSAFERDIDLVLVRAFYEHNDVAKLFLREDDEILEIWHSATELHGESDLQIIVARDQKRHAILIEDKIDAPAQPNQYERYCERGNRGIEEGRWASYAVYMSAPQKYLDSNAEAQKYHPNQVSYEVIRNALHDDPTSRAIIEIALKRSEGMLPSIIDDAVTAFWDAYYDYYEQNAPHLLLRVNRTKKGPNATWPDFKTILADAKILHKSEQGCVDLQFRGMAEQIDQLGESLKGAIDSNMMICKVGNSAAVRIQVPVMDFSKEFTSYQKEIAEVFSAINQLNDLAIRIHTKQLWR
ncbi:PD-(D/E)XK nuclease family protein [Paenibacillus sp.]